MSIRETLRAASERANALPRYARPMIVPKPCEHDWMDRGVPGDRWQECFLCGRQRDRD